MRFQILIGIAGAPTKTLGRSLLHVRPLHPRLSSVSQRETRLRGRPSLGLLRGRSGDGRAERLHDGRDDPENHRVHGRGDHDLPEHLQNAAVRHPSYSVERRVLEESRLVRRSGQTADQNDQRGFGSALGIVAGASGLLFYLAEDGEEVRVSRGTGWPPVLEGRTKEALVAVLQAGVSGVLGFFLGKLDFIQRDRQTDGLENVEIGVQNLRFFRVQGSFSFHFVLKTRMIFS